MQGDIDQVETDVFAENGAPLDPGRIYQLKRELLEPKRAVAPLDRPVQELATRPSRVIDPEIQAYFRDASDHLLRAIEQMAAACLVLYRGFNATAGCEAPSAVRVSVPRLGIARVSAGGQGQWAPLFA